MNKWWGYIHENGSIHVKIYFGPDDLKEAEESPFVSLVVRPFDAEGRDDALRIMESKVKGGE